MTSPMLLIESLERVASSSKPDTSCPTSVSLTADRAVIFSLFPPSRSVLPSKIHHPQQREHHAGEGQDCNDDDVLQNWQSTRKAPDRSDPKQCKQSKAKGNTIFPGPHLDRSACPSCHICVMWTEVNRMVTDHKAKFNFNRVNLQRRGRFQTPPPQPGILSDLDASHGSDSRSSTASCSETREHVEVEASRRQRAGASSRPQHRQRKWTEAATVFVFFVFFGSCTKLEWRQRTKYMSTWLKI